MTKTASQRDLGGCFCVCEGLQLSAAIRKAISILRQRGDVVSAGARQWVVCHADKVKWRLGLGFFALFQRREKWDQAPRDIAVYREVKPLREAKTAPLDDEARFRRMFE